MKLKLQTLVVAALVACSLNTSAQKSSNAKNNPKAYAPFDLGELKPEGWLKEWAQKAARGMTRTGWLVALRTDRLLHRRLYTPRLPA